MSTQPSYEHHPGLPAGLRKQLTELFGAERFSDSPEDLLTYAFDATRKQYLPHAVVWPETAAEIAELMRLASHEGIPIVPRGGGSGLSGGSLSVTGGILLSMERMNAILEIDAANRLVRTQTGTTLLHLKDELIHHNLFYPPDPSSAKTALLGGTLANCAGGLNCVKYGTTKDYVQALEVVLPTGEIMHLGSKARKNVVGYDLIPLFVGSEGTLGIITEATLRLLPYPPHRLAFLALYDSVSASLASVRNILASGITPSAIEYIDRRCLEAANHYVKDREMPVCDALLLIEVDGFEWNLIEKDQESLIDICRAGGAYQIEPARNEEERKAIWSVRKSLSPAMYTIAPFKTNEDICVPISEIEPTLNDAYAIGERHGLATLCFGHAGDGNIHVNYMSHREQDESAENAVGDLFAAVVRRQGSISGEHGIGITKAPYLNLELGPVEQRVMMDIKQRFDPNHILNPHKIFSSTSAT